MTSIFTSRKFIAACVSLILVVAAGLLPNLPDMQTPLTEVSTLLAAYIIGTAVEGPSPLPVLEKLKGLLKSRKFWAAFSGVGLIVLRAWLPDFPLGDEQITAIILTLTAYIFGSGLQDGLKNEAKSHEQSLP